MFWAAIAGELLSDPGDAPEPTRPADAELPALLEQSTQALLAALEARSPADACWSWHAGGENVGWVTRRQAHEALIHRVDGELAVDSPSAVDEELAADGVDEVLRVMLDAVDLPDWARFDTSGVTARLDTPDASWSMEVGDFRGTSPNSGNEYDEPAIRLIGSVSRPTASLRGAPADIDLWLWGRAGLDPIQVDGDPEVAARIRAAAVAATQ